MELNNQNQFSDISNDVESELQKGSLFLLNQIKNYNTIDKKISVIKSLNLQDEVQYTQIINGILYGMLYDDNMRLDNLPKSKETKASKRVGRGPGSGGAWAHGPRRI